MTTPSKSGVGSSLSKIREAGDALFRRSGLGRSGTGAAEQGLLPFGRRSGGFGTGWRFAYESGRDQVRGPKTEIASGYPLRAGLVCSCEPNRPVAIDGQWVLYNGAPAELGEAYCFGVRDPAGSSWLTLEFLLDPRAIQEVGLFALTLTASARPSISMHSALRIFRQSGEWDDLPGLARGFGEDVRELVDAIPVPSAIRGGMSLDIPPRYILFFPIMPFEFFLLEAAVYPGIAE